jgi:O-antigen chain-terminating methyltransferase
MSGMTEDGPAAARPEASPDDPTVSPIASIGAQVDVAKLVAEIKAEVERKAEAGVYPPDLMVELAASSDRLVSAVDAVQSTSHMQFDPPTSSHRPLLGRGLAAVKYAIQRTLRFQTMWMAAQVNTFAGNVAQATAVLAERLQEVEEQSASAAAQASHRVDRLEERMRRDETLAARLAADPANPRDRSVGTELGLDYLAFEDQFRGSEEEIGRRQAEYVPLFREQTAPTVDIGCGRGELLQELRDAGLRAYGVDQSPAMVARCHERGLDVVQGDALQHLESVGPQSLGGVFAAQVLEHLSPDEVIAFVDLAQRALVPGGVLAVETLNPQSVSTYTGPLYVDLGHVRPLHPLTLRFLAERAGFHDIELRFRSPIPDEQRLLPLPPMTGRTYADAGTDGGGTAPSEVVDAINENFRRIDATLFGPLDFALIAKR